MLCALWGADFAEERGPLQIPGSSEFHLMHRTRSIFRIPSHAQDQEHQHGTYAAGLPGICDVNLVSHTMGDGTSSVAWSMAHRQLRGRAASLSPKSRPKVHLPAQSVLCLPEILSQPLAQCAKRTGLLMTDASHRIAKPAPQSAALYLPPLSHTGRPPSARMVFSLFCLLF